MMLKMPLIGDMAQQNNKGKFEAEEEEDED